MEKSKKKAKTKAALGGIEINHDRQLPRLSRIEGQVRGLQRMIETERNCLDIVHQLSAIINALRRVQTDMVRDQLMALGETVISKNITPKMKREMADEFVAFLKQLS